MVRLLGVTSPAAFAINTWNVYVPAAAKVAVMFLAALVPLAEKVTASGAPPTSAHVYVRPASPPASAPRAVRLTAVLVTTVADAVAGVAIEGAMPVTTFTFANVAVEVAVVESELTAKPKLAEVGSDSVCDEPMAVHVMPSV